MKTNWNAARLLGLAVVALTVSGCGFHTIPPGSVGVKFNAGSGISKNLLRPEVVWVGWNEKLITYPTSINVATFVKRSDEGERQGDDSIKASTIEGAVLPVDVTVTYRIPGDSASVTQIFNNFGEMDLKEIQRQHIRWATIAAVNEVSGRKSIFDLISRERAQFGPDVKKVLAPVMEAWGFRIEEVLIREVHPPQEITDKIAEQQQHRSDLEQVRTRKKQAVTEAQTAIIAAQQKAEETRLLSQQGEQAIKLKKLERRRKFIEKWDGQSPLIGSGPLPAGW